MLGRNAQLRPDIVDRVADEGHEVGCHSYAHINAWKALPWTAVADIDAGYEGLSAWIQSNALFRPPHGKMTLPTLWATCRRGAPVWWWTIDSRDTWKKLPRPSEIADKVCKDDGGIVLMHDLDHDQERSSFVLEVTDALLDVARQKSFEVLTLKELSR
jgi:peptidoglycan/xylan/chitin deacetylase (PgdA/CDA1 family)